MRFERAALKYSSINSAGYGRVCASELCFPFGLVQLGVILSDFRYDSLTIPVNDDNRCRRLLNKLYGSKIGQNDSFTGV